jgi:hypothetical protein
MRKWLAFALLAAGFAAGASAMSLLELGVRPTYRETIRSEFVAEQAFSATREARAGNRLRAVFHRWNVVEATAENGFRIFRPDSSSREDRDFWLPFRLLVLQRIRRNLDPEGRGQRLMEADNRARLALALEAMGGHLAADAQLHAASRLAGKSPDAMRRAAEAWAEEEDSDAYRRAEAIVLGPAE